MESHWWCSFALFSMLQCLVAFLVAWQSRDVPKHLPRLTLFGILAVVCLPVFALGLPSEEGSEREPHVEIPTGRNERGHHQR